MFNFLKKDAKGPSEFVLRRRKEIEDKIAALEMERIMLDHLSQLSRHLKLQSLFPLLDRNQDGSVSVAELAEGLRHILPVSFEKSIDMAVEQVEKFDNYQVDGKLERTEFEPVLESLAKSLEFQVVDLTEQLILGIMISEDKTGDLSRYEKFLELLEKETYWDDLSKIEKMRISFGF